MISKSNLKQAATKGDINQIKGDVDQLKKEIKGLEIHFNEELARSESKIKSELIKQTDSLEKTLEIKTELLELKLKTGLRKEMDIVVERATLRTLEQMRKDRMEILGAVADFGKMASSTNDAQNLLSARVGDHEGRLVKIESKALSFPG